MKLASQSHLRKAVKECPCGKPNRTKKGSLRFNPMINEEGGIINGAGYCFSCNERFQPKDYVAVSAYRPEPPQLHYAPLEVVKASLTSKPPLLRQLEALGLSTADLKRYSIGTFQGANAFWLQDKAGRFVTAQVQAFDEELHNTGSKYLHAVHTSPWPKSDIIPAFGEHLIQRASRIAVVEAAKTALILACKYPHFTWVATLGASRLDKFLKRNTDAHITLFPDKDLQGNRWVNIAEKYGCNVFTDYWPECDDGEDLADVVLRELKERPNDIETIVRNMPGFERLTALFDWESRVIRKK